MSRFKKGDRVVNLEETELVRLHAIGTVDQDNNSMPFVIWDKIQVNGWYRLPIIEDNLQLLSEWEAEQKGEDNMAQISFIIEIDKLRAENARLRAELEELKPKPKTWEGWLYMIEGENGAHISISFDDEREPETYIARQRFTITEGEGL